MTTDSADFIAKLREIEEQANSVNAEIGPGLSGTRLQHIVVLAMRLRCRLEFGAATVVSAATRVPDGEVRSVTSEAQTV